MLAGRHREWLMRDSTIITLAYLAVCVVVIFALVGAAGSGHHRNAMAHAAFRRDEVLEHDRLRPDA